MPYLDKAKAAVVGSSSATYLVNKLLGHEVAKKVRIANNPNQTLGFGQTQTDFVDPVLLRSLPKRYDRSPGDLVA